MVSHKYHYTWTYFVHFKTLITSEGIETCVYYTLMKESMKRKSTSGTMVSVLLKWFVLVISWRFGTLEQSNVYHGKFDIN